MTRPSDRSVAVAERSATRLTARCGIRSPPATRRIATLLRFPALALFACTLANSGQAEPPAAPAADSAATVVAGFIVRDAETREAISTTAAVQMSRRRAAAYQLVVTKSRYRLDVVDGGRVVKTFPVALGNEATGAKQREGDGRTPEGTYLLVPHHPSPSFGSCFYVCYPNEADLARGSAAGVIGRGELARNRALLARKKRPDAGTGLGGLILLHAVRNRSTPGLTLRNWTLGCIAMEGSDLEELLALYRRSDRPRLEIRP